MITNLHIKNIGIIDDINIELDSGLNILSGETGAGKTLIIDSIGIICGNRFSKEMMRNGEKHSCVEACIYMPENENAIDGNIIVSREMYDNGRNLCKINGRLVTVNELKEFMKNIIDIHGQNDNQTLLDRTSHIAYLDSFIGKRIYELKTEYRELFEEYNKIKEELSNNYGDEKEKQRKLDLLRYQLKEIEEVSLKEGEDEKLEEKRKIINNSEKIMENLTIVDNTLKEETIDSINTSIRALEKLESIDKKYEEKLTELKNVYYDIQEIARDINSMKEDISYSEEERNEIEERLDVIFSLKRKYGNTIEDILKYKDKVQEEIYEIENVDEINNKLKNRLKQLEDKMYEISLKMNKIREESAKELSEKINNELSDLDMKNSKFHAKVELKNREEFNKNGLSFVEFLILTNVGGEEKPLIKIASGGEMSRIMLAIKSVLTEVDKTPILIFDEIDTGISGNAGKAIGKKMKQIAKKHQILCITHLASIAAKGDYNYYISKIVDNGQTKTKVNKLTEEETIKEVARIANGEVTKTAIEHAKELRNE